MTVKIDHLYQGPALFTFQMSKKYFVIFSNFILPDLTLHSAMQRTVGQS